MTAKTASWRLLVNTICAIALVFAAFAHRAVAPADYGDADLTAYVLPDGTLPNLCLPAKDGDGHDGPSGHPCEFCRIAASFDLPPPAADAVPCDLVLPVAVAFNASDTVLPSVAILSAPARGPPVLSI